MKLKIKYVVAFVALICAASCNKTEFLNARPDNSENTPNTLAACQAILDADKIMNGTNGIGVSPSLGMWDDAVWFPDDVYATAPAVAQAMYTWADDPYLGATVTSWNYPYEAIFYANNAIESLGNIAIGAADQAAHDNILGSALFFKAYYFYQLAQVFAVPFDSATAGQDLGIPLKATANINEKVSRATNQETYDEIIADAKASISLLPIVPLYGTRPSRPAAYGLLARLYLTVGDYKDALAYSDTSLSLKHDLMDYNTLDQNNYPPIPRFNAENEFDCIGAGATPFNYAAQVDTNFYNSYDSNDLRKINFFLVFGPQYYFFQGDYDGNYNMYSGLATDEMYLTRAEANAWLGNLAAAMTDLNTLLVTRYITGTYVTRVAANQVDAIQQIAEERKKELICRGLRWSDLRRYNKISFLKTTLTRIVNGSTFSLAPNDPKYTWPIPSDVLGFNPDMKQNTR